MAGHVRTPFLFVFVSIVLCVSLYQRYLRDVIPSFFSNQLSPSPNIISTSTFTSIPKANATATTIDASNYAISENPTAARLSSASTPPSTISTISILLPGWEILVIVSPKNTLSDPDVYFCMFDNNEVSPAKYFGLLSFPERRMFICPLPVQARRRLPFKQPVLLNSPENLPERDYPWPLLLQWSYLVYDSLTTDDDVLLFVKGVNTRQGINREPREFRCVFGDYGTKGIKTIVTSSMQEVFRCRQPEQTAVASVGGGSAGPIEVSLEIVAKNEVLPSVAYFTAPRKLESKKGKCLLCASTMVYNVAKFLREWVVYHSRIGVEKFLLYDNESDDELGKTVEELVEEGFDVSTYLWVWPKTQEAGFSHVAMYAKDVCRWMMYIDVDEFVHSPSWHKLPQPSTSLLRSLIPTKSSSRIGQLSIDCYEFGPSDQKVHPEMGVTQGYNCRRKYHNRHKSIVLLDAIDDSLLNVVHHFGLRPRYKTKKLSSSSDRMVVNHYKYQAWPEFRAKFRRRVSAYVQDWTRELNPSSHDRTPGLGFSPVEPKGWPHKFCQIHDNNLRDLTRKWFGIKSGLGYQMAWQTPL